MHEPNQSSSEFETPTRHEATQPNQLGAPSPQPIPNATAVEDVASNAMAVAATGGVRAGSPFKAGTNVNKAAAGGVATRPAFDPLHDGAASFDIGITASTAFGGLLAAYAILPFAAVSALTFPIGTILISGLGLMLSVFAFAAQRPALTAIALFLHLLLGMVGYFQML